MKTIYLSTSVFALAIAATGLASPVWAADAAAPAPKTMASSPVNSEVAPGAVAGDKADVKKFMKFSEDGQTAVRDVSAARVAIFEGDPKDASNLIDKATAALAKADSVVPNMSAKAADVAHGSEIDPDTGNDKMKMVPVDGRIALAEDYVPTPEKNAHIAKANEHLKKGETTEAVDELRLGNIDVIYNRVWMPLASTKTHLDAAEKLMGEQKYYEANLALKAIGDSLRTDSVDLVGTPVKMPLETTKNN